MPTEEYFRAEDGEEWVIESPACDTCKKEVDEICRIRQDGVRQCYDCFMAEEGPQA